MRISNTVEFFVASDCPGSSNTSENDVAASALRHGGTARPAFVRRALARGGGGHVASAGPRLCRLPRGLWVPGAIRRAFSRKRTYMRLSCGTVNSRAYSSVSTTVHGSHKTLSNARASESWEGGDALRLRVSNTAFGKSELKLVAMSKEKTLGIETTSLVMEGMDKPTPVGEAIVKLNDAFPEAFGDRSWFHSVGGMHHGVYEMRPRNSSRAGHVHDPLRVEILMMFLPNRVRSFAEWSRISRDQQLRHSVQDLA